MVLGKEIMNEGRAHSSPNLASAVTTFDQPYDDSALEGIAANVKLMLKLIEDHKDACAKGKNDSRRMLRVATIMTILDNVRTRIQKCQSFGNKKSEASLRRCNTDLRPSQAPKDKKLTGNTAVDEKEKLRRDLAACTAARKSLEMMCSSLGKEKEIMALELARKENQLNEMEELVNDLKTQNEKLVQKLQECVSKHEEHRCVGGGEAMQERFMSELLLRSDNGYRVMKKKLEEAEEENTMLYSTVDEMGAEIAASLGRIRRFKDHMMLSSEGNPDFDIQDEIIALENMFECFKLMVAKHGHKKQEEFTEIE